MTDATPPTTPDTLLADMPHPAFAKDDDFRFVAVNEAFLTVFGLERAAVIGRTAGDVLGVQDVREEHAVLVFGTPDAATVRHGGREYRFRLRREGSLSGDVLVVGTMDAAGLRSATADPVPAPAPPQTAPPFAQSGPPDPSERRTDDLSRIAHHMAVGTVLLDRDLTALAVNDALYRVWGFDPSGFGAGDPFEAFLEAGRGNRLDSLADDAWAAHVAGIRNDILHCTIPKRDIPMRDGRTISASGVALSEGRALLTFSDVSLREHSVESVAALKHTAEASERLMRNVLDNLSAAVVVYDRDNNFVLDNKTRHTLIPRYDDVMMPGKTLADFVDFIHDHRKVVVSEEPELDAIHDTDPQTWKARRLQQYDAPSRTIERRVRDDLWLEIEDRRLEDGTLVRMMMNVAELKHRQVALDKVNTLAQTSLRTLRAAIEAMPDGMAIWDHKDRFIVWNRRFMDQFPGIQARPGIRVQDMLLEFARTGVVPDARGREEEWTLEKYTEWQAGLDDEHVFETHDGRWIKRIDRRTPEGMRVGLRTDVTDLKRREIEMQKAKDTAETAERSKSEFLANMSHEIRTPMNGILGMAEILARTELDERQQKFAGIIVTSGNALLTIINDILDFSKIDAGQLSLHPEPFRLSRAIDDVATLLATRSAEKDLEVIVRIAPDVPDRLIGDAGRLRQIVTNLMGNAVKFTETGHVLIDVETTPGARDAEGRETVALNCRVIDTGIGISPDRVDEVFKKFSQVDTSSTRKHEGTGLGLAISMRLVELMGGEIGCESTVGEGSTFWFTVPLPVDTMGRRQKAPPADLTGARILVIDDNAVNRAILLEQLDAWGFEGVAVESGEEGLSALREGHGAGRPFRAVVLDFQMPDTNGTQVAASIREDADLGDTPIVMLTSIDLDVGAPAFRALRIDGYLVKPARSAMLLRAIVSAIRDRASARPGAEEGDEDVQDADWALRTLAEPEGQGERQDECAADVLVVDDNRVNRFIVCEVLATLGLSTVMADSGIAAIEAYGANRPRLVVMDVTMPRMDGHEATRRIRDIEAGTGGPRVPIIGATAHAADEDRRACIDAGMDDYISKPISPGDLREKVRLWLSGEGAEGAEGEAEATPSVPSMSGAG